MTEEQKSLLLQCLSGEIYEEDFLEQFPLDLERGGEKVISEVITAMKAGIAEDLDLAIELLFFYEDLSAFLDLLNDLLIFPGHHFHQNICFKLQKLKNPLSIPFIRKALASNFDYLQYTCSEDAVIAKWFSHALWNIGTPDSIAMIEEFSESENEGIREEMRYRLKRIAGSR